MSLYINIVNKLGYIYTKSHNKTIIAYVYIDHLKYI